MKRLSIVIPSLNVCQYLERLLKQFDLHGKPDWLEIVCVDGLSNDGTAELIENYKSIVDVVIIEKDKGQSDAINKGFRNSSGEFVTWVNADDLIDVASLASVFRAIDGADYDMFTFNSVFINCRDQIVSFKPSVRPLRVFFDFYPGTIVGGPSAIFRRSSLPMDPLDIRLHFGMDIDLYRRILQSRWKVKNVNIYFWYFRIHVNSKTSPSILSSAHPRHIYEKNLIDARYSYTPVKRMIGVWLIRMQRLFMLRTYYSFFLNALYRGKTVF